MERGKESKLKRIITVYAVRLSIILIALIAAINALPAGAWFSTARKAAGVSDFENPAKIYIRAANREDIKYINLSSLNKEKAEALGDQYADPDKRYYDVVFSVEGDDIQSYLLQLGFTTNNQVEYFIYPAVLTSVRPSSAVMPIVVDFTTHELTATGAPMGTQQYYYSSRDALSGAYLNRSSSAVILADGTLHATYSYADGSSSGSYDTVDKYAEPLYWQTTSPIPVASGDLDAGTTHFCHYYILRVAWPSSDRANDKETDIVYIAAKEAV